MTIIPAFEPKHIATSGRTGKEDPETRNGTWRSARSRLYDIKRECAMVRLPSDSNPDPSTTRKLTPRSHGVAACSAGFNRPERRFSFKR